MLAGADPAMVFRLIAEEALTLMAGAATLVAVPLDDKRRLARSTTWSS